MIWLVATFFSAILFGIGSFLLKVGSHKKYSENSMLLGLYLSGSFLLLCVVLVNGELNFSLAIILFSILIGLGSYYGNLFLVKAFNLGPASLTAPLMNISVLFVILLSAFLYHENITSWQYVGISFILLGTTLLGCNFKNTLIKNKTWITFVILGIFSLFLREGGLKIAYENGLNNRIILFYGYVFATLLAGKTLWLSSRIADNKSKEYVNHHPAFFLGSIIGVFSAMGMGLLAFAITSGPAAVIIPIFSARNIITVSLVVLFFKEKMSLLQWIAMSFIIVGTIFIF